MESEKIKLNHAKLITSEKVFDAKVFHVVKDHVILPNGVERTNHVVRLPKAVSVLAINSNSEIALLHQYRYPFDEYLWEIPAGIVDQGEEPEAAAFRELEEELGYRSARLEHILTYYQLCSVADPIMSIFIARDIVKSTTNRDASEVIDKITFKPLSEALEMISRGEIKNAFTIIAIMHAALKAR